MSVRLRCRLKATLVPACQTEGHLVKIAYFITSYSSPEMVMRLTRTLRLGDPDGIVLLHHDVHRSAIDVEEFRRLGVVVFTSDAPIVWGDMTLEAVRWRIYRWVAREVNFDWLVLLSEQDYPVAPLGALKDYLSRADCDAVVETFDLGPESGRLYGYTYSELPGPGIEHRFSLVDTPCTGSATRPSRSSTRRRSGSLSTCSPRTWVCPARWA